MSDGLSIFGPFDCKDILILHCVSYHVQAQASLILRTSPGVIYYCDISIGGINKMQRIAGVNNLLSAQGIPLHKDIISE